MPPNHAVANGNNATATINSKIGKAQPNTPAKFSGTPKLVIALREPAGSAIFVIPATPKTAAKINLAISKIISIVIF